MTASTEAGRPGGAAVSEGEVTMHSRPSGHPERSEGSFGARRSFAPLGMTESRQRASAAATAREAMTLIIAARYSAEPCRSALMSVVGIFTAFAASGVKLLA